ncbi:FAD synthetase family protein [Neomegalonema perideroedes]|uniref:FAD synthetase family protein n=1 Tax=Neomegalonema perideroedes TaxID=217219 RepID=UPI00036D2245|nr:FAD synthetase family protein [Neomegalonema perideroedes]
MSLDFSGAPTRIVTDRQIRLDASVLAIGAFDGVHLGHQALISAAVAEARERGVPAVVWTFDPPPKVFFGRAARISPSFEKLARIARLGPDWIVVAPFTAAYAARSAEDFLEDLARAGPLAAHVGADFRFGAKQSGDAALLGRRFPLRQAPVVACREGERISSSRIRALRAEGRQGEAAALLAAPQALAAFGAGLLTLDVRQGEDEFNV